jgi:adenine-specific DNA methylase
MTQLYPKRLIEVDLPIKRISAHSRREKSIRHGHISSLHIWWARRPLAACRAVICAALWPDPADPLCPQGFRDKASKLITEFANAAVTNKALGESCDHQTWIKWQSLTKNGGLDGHEQAHWNVLRFALLDFIADFANWDNSTVQEYLDTSRALTQAAHEALGGEPGTRPLVADPFAGGGSIPLEALRVGADAFASDLNPVPVLLNKVVLEYIPKYGPKLTEQVKQSASALREALEQRLKDFYFTLPSDEKRHVFFWARTIACAGPACGYQFPLLRSLWLRQKSKKGVAFKLKKNQATKQVDVEVIYPLSASEVGDGTSKQGAATCPVCGYTTPVEIVREQLSEKHGGATDAKFLAVGVTKPGEVGKHYRLPSADELHQFDKATTEYLREKNKTADGIFTIPDDPLNHLRGFFNVVLYGMKTWGDLFNPRQALLMANLASLIKQEYARLARLDSDLAEAVATCLALTAGKVAQYNSSCCRWKPTGETLVDMFGRQAIPMVWDFAEAYPFSGSTGDFAQYAEASYAVLENMTYLVANAGSVQQSSATAHPLPDDSVDALVTDPPYYDAIPYADLSDFFYVWLRRMLGDVHPQLFSEPLSPKKDECVTLSHRAAMYRHKDRGFFERMMTVATSEARRYTKPSGIGVVVFANKSTSGWEAMLTALVDSGWIVSASWPIDTEMSSRLRAQDSAVLASSVHLVCRPRANPNGPVPTDEIGDWRDVLHELPPRIHEWMPRLAEEGIVGADAIFACLGPALEVFSRYSRVEKGNGEAVTLKEYLEHVWAAVAKEALAMVFKGADATGFEADARLTAMWLWTLMSPDADGNTERGDEESAPEDDSESKKTKIVGFALEFDAARKIAQGLGADLENLNHLVEITGEQAHLLSVSKRTRYLFGKDEEEPTGVTGRKKKSAQLDMFAELTDPVGAESAWREKTVKRVGDTTLDRVHQGMILFAAGRGEALKRFVVEDGVGRDSKFWRLAQALSALYPSGSDEKRWVDGVLARKKQFGF